jgi:dihydrofolate synthase/folylpolyglutamate synthase
MNNAYQRLESLEIIGVKLGLGNIRTLLAELDNPQRSFPSILIAGTNGKGSVGAMLAEVLLQHGLRTGHYVSPHLADVRERIRINNELIQSTEFEIELSVVLAAVDRLLASGLLEHHPTYFETLTAAAFLWFAREKVDWAVVEVGMGGRFDATNVVEQRLSIITTIDFDHESYLGQTLSEIAGEKAGIVKRGGPLVVGNLPPEARMAALAAAQENDAAWRETSASDIRNLILEDGYPVFEYEPWKEKIQVSLRGRHQAENASTALLACEVLRDLGVAVDREKVRSGLANVRWRGRLELLSAAPPILVDCAHNPAGARSLAAFFDDMNWPRVVALFTAMSDKKYGPMLQLLSPRIETLFLTRVQPLNRCATAVQLGQAAEAAGLQHEMVDDPTRAFVRAKQEAESQGLPLVVFGSMYLVGLLLKAQGDCS